MFDLFWRQSEKVLKRELQCYLPVHRAVRKDCMVRAPAAPAER
jgi:hypothetical protein